VETPRDGQELAFDAIRQNGSDEAGKASLGLAGVLGVLTLLVASCASPGLPAVTADPKSIPYGGLELWQDNDHGTLTGLEANVHRPSSPWLDMSKTQAENACPGAVPREDDARGHACVAHISF
jgi:hypothetical protein